MTYTTEELEYLREYEKKYCSSPMSEDQKEYVINCRRRDTFSDEDFFRILEETVSEKAYLDALTKKEREIAIPKINKLKEEYSEGSEEYMDKFLDIIYSFIENAEDVEDLDKAI